MHRHRWTEWCVPTRFYYNTSAYYQRKTCLTCNKVVERIV